MNFSTAINYLASYFRDVDPNAFLFLPYYEGYVCFIPYLIFMIKLIVLFYLITAYKTQATLDPIRGAPQG